MPVEYSGIVDEHMAVRTRAGLFDVSHMGEIEIAGKDALDGGPAHHLATTPSKLAVGQAQYSALTTPAGHVRRRRADLPAGGRALHAGRQRVEHHQGLRTGSPSTIAGGGDAVAVNTSSRYALIALQGPAARDVLQTLTGVDLGDIKYYWFAHGEVAGVRAHDLAHRLHRRGRLRGLRAAGIGRARLGRDPRRPASRPASSRRASARATRCASKRRCACTATTSTRRRPCSKPISAGSSAGRRSDFIGADVLRRQKAEGVAPQAGRLRDARPRASRATGYDVVRRRRARPASSPAARRRRS